MNALHFSVSVSDCFARYVAAAIERRLAELAQKDDPILGRKMQ